VYFCCWHSDQESVPPQKSSIEVGDHIFERWHQACYQVFKDREPVRAKYVMNKK